MWLVFIIISPFIIYFALKRRQQARIKRWRTALALNNHDAVYQQLYADVNGFTLSQQARSNQSAIDFVYGEIVFESFIALLSLCKPNPSTIFYDLGSGTGKAVLACAMVFTIKKGYGIELLLPLHQAAQLQQQRLRQLPPYQTKADCIEFKQANILESDLSNASLVFINATSFFGETWLAISKQVERIKPGALVISTSKPLRSRQFNINKVTQVAMSWGIVNAFIQQRLSDSFDQIDV